MFPSGKTLLSGIAKCRFGPSFLKSVNSWLNKKDRRIELTLTLSHQHHNYWAGGSVSFFFCLNEYSIVYTEWNKSDSRNQEKLIPKYVIAQWVGHSAEAWEKRIWDSTWIKAWWDLLGVCLVTRLLALMGCVRLYLLWEGADVPYRPNSRKQFMVSNPRSPSTSGLSTSSFLIVLLIWLHTQFAICFAS